VDKQQYLFFSDLAQYWWRYLVKIQLIDCGYSISFNIMVADSCDLDNLFFSVQQKVHLYHLCHWCCYIKYLVLLHKMFFNMYISIWSSVSCRVFSKQTLILQHIFWNSSLVLSTAGYQNSWWVTWSGHHWFTQMYIFYS
jgi:hypothetical protein